MVWTAHLQVWLYAAIIDDIIRWQKLNFAVKTVGDTNLLVSEAYNRKLLSLIES